MVKILIGSLVLVLVVVGYFSFRFWRLGMLSREMTPPGLGVSEGKLSPCGPKPNCFLGDLKFSAGREKIPEIIKGIGGELMSAREDYFHFTFTSRLFGFVDDLEIYFPKDFPGKLLIRSASRVGHSDIGANKKRVEKIRGLLN